jgi:1,4-dihydroxy-2-naphthoyl-CoA hydrolase
MTILPRQVRTTAKPHTPACHQHLQRLTSASHYHTNDEDNHRAYRVWQVDFLHGDTDPAPVRNISDVKFDAHRDQLSIMIGTVPLPVLRSSSVWPQKGCSSMMSTPVRSGMPRHFGIRIADADKDKLVGELDVDERHLNNSGHVHGGALAAFADDLGGTLAGLNVPPGFRTTTIESKTNIFRACLPGRLTGVAVPVHVGHRLIVLQISIYRADGKRAAMMIQTQMVLAREAATPSREGGDKA